MIMKKLLIILILSLLILTGCQNKTQKNDLTSYKIEKIDGTKNIIKLNFDYEKLNLKPKFKMLDLDNVYDGYLFGSVTDFSGMGQGGKSDNIYLYNIKNNEFKILENNDDKRILSVFKKDQKLYILKAPSLTSASFYVLNIENKKQNLIQEFNLNTVSSNIDFVYDNNNLYLICDDFKNKENKIDVTQKLFKINEDDTLSLLYENTSTNYENVLHFITIKDKLYAHDNKKIFLFENDKPKQILETKDYNIENFSINGNNIYLLNKVLLTKEEKEEYVKQNVYKYDMDDANYDYELVHLLDGKEVKKIRLKTLYVGPIEICFDNIIIPYDKQEKGIYIIDNKFEEIKEVQLNDIDYFKFDKDKLYYTNFKDTFMYMYPLSK